MMRSAIAVGLLMAVSAAVAVWAVESQAPAGAERVRHVVIFKFKDAASAEQIKAAEEAFRALPSKIPQIRDFEWGTNISPENLANGFTHCFFLTFDNEKDRNDYLPHPAHKEFGKLVGPILDKVLVVDYKAKK